MSVNNPASPLDALIKQAAQVLAAAASNRNFTGNIYFRFFKDAQGRISLQHHSVSLRTDEGIGVRQYHGGAR